MNFKDLLGQFIGTILRALMAPLVVWLASKGILSESETAQVVLMVGAILTTLIWGVINKFLWSEKVDVALNLPARSTYEDIKNILK